LNVLLLFTYLSIVVTFVFAKWSHFNCVYLHRQQTKLLQPLSLFTPGWKCVRVCVCMWMCVSVFVSVQWEREKERERECGSLLLCVCVLYLTQAHENISSSNIYSLHNFRRLTCLCLSPSLSLSHTHTHSLTLLSPLLSPPSLPKVS